MENKYIFRVITETEKEFGIKSFKTFECDPYSFLINDPRLGEDVLDMVTTQITKGNTTGTFWISCTKSFDIAIRNYATTQSDFRPYLAVISNHNQDYCNLDEIKKILNSNLQTLPNYSNEEIRKLRISYLNKLEKFVLDMSQLDSTNPAALYNKLCRCNMIHTKNGKVQLYPSVSEVNYARSDNEVLVFNHIPKSDYFLLSPFQYDIIHALMSSNINFNLDELILYVREHFDFKELYYEKYKYDLNNIGDLAQQFLYELSCDIEINMFDKMYLKRLSFDRLNAKGISTDILNEFRGGFVCRALKLMVKDFKDIQTMHEIYCLDFDSRIQNDKFKTLELYNAGKK